MDNYLGKVGKNNDPEKGNDPRKGPELGGNVAKAWEIATLMRNGHGVTDRTVEEQLVGDPMVAGPCVLSITLSWLDLPDLKPPKLNFS